MEKFRLPFRILVAGPSGSGKTILIRNILKEWRYTISDTPAPLTVLWVHGHEQMVHNTPISDSVHITYSKRLPTVVELKESRPTILVVDDLMNELADSDELSNIFTKHSHHLGIGVFLLVQNLFARGKKTRNISLNADGILLMKNVRDQTQADILARQMFPNQRKQFLSVYKRATLKPFSYLFIDLKPDTEEHLRLRSRLLHSELPIGLNKLTVAPIIHFLE